MSVAGAHIGAAAAAAAKRRQQEEEEGMTQYAEGDLEGWEFKIVRSLTARFRKPEALKQLCQEEAQAGWEMVEKFDDNRVRFKRPVEKRSGNSHLDLDPYRTRVGMSEVALAFTILAGIAVAFLLVMLLVNRPG